jgi:Uma2 family endonuclease
LRDNLPSNYIRLSNELGLKLPEKSRRNLDLAIFDKNKFTDRADLFSNKYAQMPPEIVIEIDTKADLSDFDDPANYYYRKTDQLLQYGVGKIIWVFTGTRKYLYAEAGKKWAIGNWSEEIELMPGIVLNIQKLLDEV